MNVFKQKMVGLFPKKKEHEMIRDILQEEIYVNEMDMRSSNNCLYRVC